MDIVREITAEHVAYWVDHGPVVVTFGAPKGMDDCASCESVVTDAGEGSIVRTPWKPSEIDLAHLARGGTIWLSTWGGLPPHMLEVQPPAEGDQP